MVKDVDAADLIAFENAQQQVSAANSAIGGAESTQVSHMSTCPHILSVQHLFTS